MIFIGAYVGVFHTVGFSKKKHQIYTEIHDSEESL